MRPGSIGHERYRCGSPVIGRTPPVPGKQSCSPATTVRRLKISSVMGDSPSIAKLADVLAAQARPGKACHVNGDQSSVPSTRGNRAAACDISATVPGMAESPKAPSYLRAAFCYKAGLRRQHRAPQTSALIGAKPGSVCSRMTVDVRFGSLGDMAAFLSMSALPPIADIKADIASSAKYWHDTTGAPRNVSWDGPASPSVFAAPVQRLAPITALV